MDRRAALELAQINVYPVKGCRGFSPAQWELDRFGLRWDRAFMVADPAGHFLTQREEPKLARVFTALEPAGPRAEQLVLQADGFGAQRVPLGPQAPQGKRVPAEVWSFRGEAIDQGEGPAEFLSEFLGRPLRLLRTAPDHARRVELAEDEDPAYTGFADGYPLLIATQASLDALNARIAAPLPMARFRPNLVIAGAGAYAEDVWARVRIGGSGAGAVELDVVKGCDRCAVTTVDPERGERAGPEPLRALARYRRRGGAVYFGQNAVHRGLGALARGAALEVLSTRPPPEFEPDLGPERG